MLDAKNIKIQRLNKLLDYKNLKPFEIVKVHNNIIYKLNLFNLINKLYPIFHFQLLYLINGNLLLKQVNAPPLLIIINSKTKIGEYYIKKILNTKINKRKKNLLIKKKGCLIYKIKYLKYNKYNIILK